ncbi:MAG: UDP-2,3-diacylglucosamine diphosphatase [Victivallaceae bacterium]
MKKTHQMPHKEKYKTLFLSDIHLGTKYCHSEKLLEFLKTINVEKIYLIGDIVDLSAIRRKFYWDSTHNALIRKFFKLVKNGVEIIYIPGNHDIEIRDFDGMDFSGIKIVKESIHETADAKRFLVMHGDKFDGIMSEKLSFLYALGDRGYDLALFLNRILNIFIRPFGIHWSLSKYLKTKVKNVVKFVNDYENLLLHEARNHPDISGIICGHIHTPELKNVDGIVYANCGCWTEYCSAIAEAHDGSLSMINLDSRMG